MAKSSRFAKTLKVANARVNRLTKLIGNAERQVVGSTTDAVKSTDYYVKHNPWKAMGAAAVTCFAIGTLLRRG